MIEETLCPECNSKMIARDGKFGKFWGCKNYPQCKGTRDSMGRSRQDREDWKKEQAKLKGEDHEDIGPDSYNPSRSEEKTNYSFNKRK